MLMFHSNAQPCKKMCLLTFKGLLHSSYVVNALELKMLHTNPDLPFS